MSRLFARLAVGGKKKDVRNAPPTSPRPTSAVPSASNDDRRSPISPRPPRIELEFGASSAAGSASSFGLASQSTATSLLLSSPPRNGNAEGDGQRNEGMSEVELIKLAQEQLDWAQVEHAWAVAGKELLVIGLETPHLFEEACLITTEMTDQINRLFAIFIISTCPSPLAALPAFPSLTDIYPAPEFIPTTPGWFDNEFTTHVRWVKDPRVLAGFLRRATSQLAAVTEDTKHREEQEKEEGKSRTIPLPTWYTTFIASDESSAYPPDAYTALLSPLIAQNQHVALSRIFDTWVLIDASSRVNLTPARSLAHVAAWWIMACPVRWSRSAQQIGNAAPGFQKFYDTWVEAGEALYRLFMCWIRNQQTGTLPLRAIEHVHSYPDFSSGNDADTETDVLLCNVTCALPSISTGTRTRVRDAVPASSAEMVAALCEAIDRESVSGTIGRNGEYDISSWQRTAQSSPTGAEEGVPTIREILQAIRDLQSHASSSSTRDSSIHTPPAKTGTEQEPLYRPFRTPSSSSFMQEMDMPYRSPSASGGIPHSTADISALGLPSNSPYSSTAEVTDVPAGPGPSWTDFAQSGFSGGGVTLPKEPFVLGEAFREAPQLAKPPPPQRSQKATALGIGRPGQGMVCGARPLGAYTFKSIGVTRLRSSFFEFERDARRVPRATDGWPTFAVIALDASVIQRFDLRSRYILVLIDVAQPKIPEAPPTPIEKDDRSLKPFQSPLQTPPLPPHIAQTGYATPSSDDSEKRNRRRSFFRSFSGGSSKNRKSISSPLSSPSIPTVRMAESPLPRVIEKREPLLTSPRPRSTTKVSVTSLVVSTPSPNHAEPSSRPSMHSQSPSSVYRKPAPVLGQDELRELERSESQTRASIDVRHANDGNDKAIIPITTIDATEDDLELIQSNSLGSSSFTRNNSESPKSLPRRRRSMAPSPASIGDGLTEDDVPVEALDKLALDDEDTRQKCNGAIETTNESQSPSNGQSLNVQPESSNGNVRQADTVEQRVDGKDWGSTTLQAPVTLGASL